MKKVLITGANSYIGTAFEQYLLQNYPGEYVVDTVDMVDGTWRTKDFSGYHSIFHVAGIAHSDSGKISEEKAKLYYAVNTNLTVETAQKAKADGAGQFVFMSSAIVYGESAPIGKMKLITSETLPTPANCYGDSKLQAERGILPLQDDDFHVVVLRPPIIYGKGSKGNYPLLSKIARKTPIFPAVDNRRSVLYVENLCEFVCLMIRNREKGIFHPQNDRQVSTSDWVKEIAGVHGKKMYLVKGFGWALRLMSHVTSVVNKAFGSFCYDESLSVYKENYRVCDLQESIKRTEKTL